MCLIRILTDSVLLLHGHFFESQYNFRLSNLQKSFTIFGESPEQRRECSFSAENILLCTCVVFLLSWKSSVPKSTSWNFPQLLLATSHQKLHDLLMTSSNFLKEKIMRTLGVMRRHKFLTIAGATLMVTIKNVYV